MGCGWCLVGLPASASQLAWVLVATAPLGLNSTVPGQSGVYIMRVSACPGLSSWSSEVSCTIAIITFYAKDREANSGVYGST